MARHSMLESNIIESFSSAKKDISKLMTDMQSMSANLTSMREEQSKLKVLYAQIESKLTDLQINKEAALLPDMIKSSPRKSVKFVASKTGKKFHTENCIFAKNIKPKMQLVFKSKAAALNRGLKPCHCILRI